MSDLWSTDRALGLLADCPIRHLGNVGLPVPEGSILIVSDYLAWQGDRNLPLVISVGTISAAAGDIIGFWIGRKYGHAGIDR
jgi:membrane protein DedA with SNARE-associated domain